MDFELSEEQRMIRRHIRKLCEDFDDEYWRRKDMDHEFPHEFFDVYAENGWSGLTIPEEYGGQGYGVQEASIVLQEITRSGAALAGMSTVQQSTFTTKPLVVYGDDEHKERYLPDIAAGNYQVCTGVTEPNAGLDTSRIEVSAERDGDEYVINGQKIWTSIAQEADTILLLTRTAPRKEDDRFDGLSLFFTRFDKDMDGVTVKEIPKAGRSAADSNEVWFEDFRIPAADRIGDEGNGFYYLLDFANPERILVASGAVGLGQRAIEKAAAYANERVVFGNKIGSYQGVQHPLADSWSKLMLDELMVRKAAWLYDHEKDCAAEANAVKMRASEDALQACRRAIKTHGGMGYAKEYDVERYWREIMILILGPLTNELVKNYLAEKELGLPKSY